MSGDKYALLIMVVIAAALAAHQFHIRNERRKATAHENDEKIFRTAPRWAGRLSEKLDQVLAGQRRLHQHIGSEADADEKRDTEMSAETQAAIDELKAEVAPMTDAVTAVATTVDRLVAMIEEAGDDPDEIRAVVANFKSERDRIVAAALKGTPIDPSAN